MILTKTPLRVSLAGGGTDMASFYTRQVGAVVSFTIDKYMYVGLNRKFDGKTRVSYSETEIVDHPRELKHQLAREVLGYFGTNGVEITSISDIPGEGTGLGSSSAFTVGLIRALSAYSDAGISLTESALAELAYHVERNQCGYPVGKQDQYAVAHGGLKFYIFNSNEIVDVETLGDLAVLKGLESHLMLFYTGATRKANLILSEQDKNIKQDIQLGTKLRSLAIELRDQFRKGNYLAVGDVLGRGWALKKQLASDITNTWLNDIYDQAIDAGAIGGKLLGAGGGGFFLFAVPQAKQESVAAALSLKRVPFRIDCEGSRVIYESEKVAVC